MERQRQSAGLLHFRHRADRHVGDADSFSSFVVSPGQMYHVESGAIFHIENVGDTQAELILAFRSEHPQHFSLRSSFSVMTDAVLGNTYDLPASAFVAFDRSPGGQIVRREVPADIPSTAELPNARLFDAEGQRAPLSYAYGQAKLARKQYRAALDDLSMYSLPFKENGMREPHWHPVTAKMGYVAKGHARTRVLDPDGTLDEYVLSPGDAYFVPRAYPHHIEDIGQDDINFLIFFDQPTPGDIGYRATATAFSREALGRDHQRDRQWRPGRRGEIGEVCVRGPALAVGYLNDPRATAAAFIHCWLHTGDLGYLNDDGYLFLSSRIKDMINRGGEKIAPQAIETILLAHPAVQDALVFLVPDPKYGEEVSAAVILEPGGHATEADLQRHCQASLAAFEIPRRSTSSTGSRAPPQATLTAARSPSHCDNQLACGCPEPPALGLFAPGSGHLLPSRLSHLGKTPSGTEPLQGLKGDEGQGDARLSPPEIRTAVTAFEMPAPHRSRTLYRDTRT